MVQDSNLKSILEIVEKWVISEASKQCKSTYELAKYLEISQPSVVRKLKKYVDQNKKEPPIF